MTSTHVELFYKILLISVSCQLGFMISSNFDNFLQSQCHPRLHQQKKRIMPNTFTSTSPGENPIAFQECFPVFHEHRSVEWSDSFLDDPIYFFESSSYNGARIEAGNWKTFLQLAIMLSSLIACPCFLVKMLLRVKRSRLRFLIVSSNKRENAWNWESLRRAFWE